MKKITFILNNKKVNASDDETIWQIAKREGLLIPHLCHSDEIGYEPDGNCSACMVEIEGERTLAPSCIRRPSEGMKLTTKCILQVIRWPNTHSLENRPKEMPEKTAKSEIFDHFSTYF